MMAQAAGRDAIKAGDINTAADEGVGPTRARLHRTSPRAKHGTWRLPP